MLIFLHIKISSRKKIKEILLHRIKPKSLSLALSSYIASTCLLIFLQHYSSQASHRSFTQAVPCLKCSPFPYNHHTFSTPHSPILTIAFPAYQIPSHPLKPTSNVPPLETLTPSLISCCFPYSGLIAFANILPSLHL